MKVTIRFSVDGETDGALRNALLAALSAKGIALKQNETATYESMSIAPADLSKALAEFWRVADNHQGPGRIDHCWMYAGQ